MEDVFLTYEEIQEIADEEIAEGFENEDEEREPSEIAVKIVSFCRLGWCYEDSMMIANDLDSQFGHDTLEEFYNQAKKCEYSSLENKRNMFIDFINTN